MEEIIIVGGGASGLMAAIVAARSIKAVMSKATDMPNKKVTILEHKDKVGKKILATGNGRCNYTNSFMDTSCFRSDNIDFVNEALDKFSYEETVDFFMNLGVLPKEIKGYIYPNSEQALSVLKALELEAIELGVNIVCDIDVSNIKKTNDNFIIQTSSGKYTCKQVILATGGCSSPNLGSDGSGLRIAKNLGHRIIKPLPALVQLRSDEKYFKMIAGVRVDGHIGVYVNDELITSELGELQFTKYGVSGIPILQTSRFVSKALDQSKKVMLKIDLLADFDWKATMDLLENRIHINSYKNMEELFYGLFNNKLVLCILKRTGISEKLLCKNIEKKQLINLVNMVKSFNVTINGTNSFDQSQVTAGGVDTSQVDPDTMESRIIKGLYFCGEILDVDGTCGGYNLQWAWSSGYLAGRSI